MKDKTKKKDKNDAEMQECIDELGNLGIFFGTTPEEAQKNLEEHKVSSISAYDCKKSHNSPFDTSAFNYIMILPEDGSISRDSFLSNIFSQGQSYNDLMDFIRQNNDAISNDANEKGNLEHIRYSRIVKALLDLTQERIESLRDLARANNVSILQQLFENHSSEVVNERDLTQDIEIINNLDWYISQIFSHNSRYNEKFSLLVLGELYRKMIKLGISPIALVLSNASDYLSPTELHKITKNIAPKEWGPAWRIKLINGDQEEAINLLEMNPHILDKNKLESVLTMAIKFNRSKVAEFILNKLHLIITAPNYVASNTIIYDIFKSNVFSAIIRGNIRTCIKFLAPKMSVFYQSIDLEIVKLIIQRSGSEAREHLLDYLFKANGNIKNVLNIYFKLIDDDHAEEEPTCLEESFAPVVVKTLIREFNNPTSQEIKINTLSYIIRTITERQENLVLKILYDKGILTLDLYDEIYNRFTTQNLKEKTKSLFSYYIKDLYFKKHRDHISDHLKGQDQAKFLSAFKTLHKNEKKNFIKDLNRSVETVIKDKKASISNKKVTLEANRQILEWVEKDELIIYDSTEKEIFNSIMDNISASIADINAKLFFPEEDEISNPTQKKKKKKKSTDFKKGSKKAPPSQNEQNSKKPITFQDNDTKKQSPLVTKEDNSVSDLKITAIEETTEGWQMVGPKKKSKQEKNIDNSSNNPDAPSGGDGALKSSKKSSKKTASATKEESQLQEKSGTKYKLDNLSAKKNKEGSNSSQYKQTSKKPIEFQSNDTKDTPPLVAEVKDNPEPKNKKSFSATESAKETPELQKTSNIRYSNSSTSNKDSALSDKIDPSEWISYPSIDNIEPEKKAKVAQAEITPSIMEKKPTKPSSESSHDDNIGYQSYLGNDGATHFVEVNQQTYYPPPQHPVFIPTVPCVMQIPCNAYYYNERGERIAVYIGTDGKGINPDGTVFTTLPYYPLLPPSENATNPYYTNGDGGGFGGSDRERAPRERMKPNRGEEKQLKAVVEEEIPQENFKETIISISSPLPKEKAIYAEVIEYQESLKEVNNRKNDNKVTRQIDDTHHFDLESQNASHISISSDEDMMPKLFSGDFFRAFIGDEKLNIDTNLM